MRLLPSYDSQFITLFRFRNGYVRRHVAADVEASDYKDVEMIAIEKAMLGMRVDILPVLLANDPLRSVISPDAFENKNPDIRINGVLWEIENSSNSLKMNNLKHAIDEGSKQANHLIINISHTIDESFMFRIVKGRFKDHNNLETVEFRFNGSYIVFYK